MFESNFAIALVLHSSALSLAKNLFRFIKIKTNRDLLARFFRAWRRLKVFASSSQWSIRLLASVLISQSNCFRFGFTKETAIKVL